MNRRGFLGACLAVCAAPAIVRADSLMRIIPKKTTLLYGEFGLCEEVLVIDHSAHPFFGRAVIAMRIHKAANAELNRRACEMLVGLKWDRGPIFLEKIRDRVVAENRSILARGSSQGYPGSWMPIDDGVHHGQEKGRREEVLGIRPSEPEGPECPPVKPPPVRGG